MKKTLLPLAILIISACASNNGIYKKSENVVNEITKKIPYPWKEINNEGSDYALSNEETHSIFLFNSSCRKFQSSSLTTLTSSILTGIEELKVIEKNSIFTQDRNAIEIVVNGKLDGISRAFKIVTVQKNNCIYDYVLISINTDSLNKDSKHFKTFLERIKLN